MSNVMEVRGLSKVFRRTARRAWGWPLRHARTQPLSASTLSEQYEKVALHPVHFDVAAGDSVAFIGPNGAGKSTTIKMLTGILHPTAGDARVLGMRPWERRVALSYRIGTVFGQKSQLWYHLPPRDTFALMRRIYSLPQVEYLTRRDELVDRFGLGPLMDTPVRKLSLGERMRCEIALSFLHKPEILFLDEPTIGLDVVVKQQVRELIRHLNREDGVTVFLTSHDATDVEALCDRVLVINHGHLLFDGLTTQMVQRFLHYKEIGLEVSDGPLQFEADGVEVKWREGKSVCFVVDVRRTPVNKVLAYALQHHEVQDVRIVEPSMEEIIRAIYTEQPSHRDSFPGVSRGAN